MPYFDQSLIFLLSLHRPPGAGNDPVVEGNCVIVYEADGYGGEYTKPNAGQAKYEGWTKEGKARFKVLRKLNKDGGASANNNHLEQAILSQVRAHLNIAINTGTPQSCLVLNGRQTDGSFVNAISEYS